MTMMIVMAMEMVMVRILAMRLDVNLSVNLLEAVCQRGIWRVRQVKAGSRTDQTEQNNGGPQWRTEERHHDHGSGQACLVDEQVRAPDSCSCCQLAQTFLRFSDSGEQHWAPAGCWLPAQCPLRSSQWSRCYDEQLRAASALCSVLRRASTQRSESHSLPQRLHSSPHRPTIVAGNIHQIFYTARSLFPLLE